jgi:tetratricopeptide (TPR) repeat protein
MLCLAGALLLSFVLGWGPWCRQRGIAAMAARDYEAAERWLDRSAWLGAWSETRFWRARLHRKMLDIGQAVAELDAAALRGLDPQRVARERLLIQAQSGRLAGIEPQLKQWFLSVDAGVDGNDLCEAYVNGLMMNGRARDAEVVIQSWKLSDPHDPQPYLAWGRWLESQFQIEPAEREYEAALLCSPHTAAANYALGRLKLNRVEARAALSHFEQASQQLAANAAPRMGMARCHYELGEFDLARSLLEQLAQESDEQLARSFALVQDPDPSRPVEKLLGELLAGAGEADRALPLLERALEVEPRDPSLRYLKAQCLQTAGRHDEARALFEEVAADRAAISEADRLVDQIHDHPEQPQVDLRLRVGELFWKHDSARKAEFWLKSVLVFDPRNATANRLLAEYYERRSRSEPALSSAAEHYRRAAESAVRDE